MQTCGRPQHSFHSCVMAGGFLAASSLNLINNVQKKTPPYTVQHVDTDGLTIWSLLIRVFSWIPVTKVHNKNGPKYTQHFPGIKVIFSEGKIRKEWVKWQFVKNDKYNQSGNGAATFSPQVSHHPEFLQVHLSCITFTPCYLSLLMIMVASVGSWNRMNIIALVMICMVVFVRWWNLTSNSVNHHVWNW